MRVIGRLQIAISILPLCVAVQAIAQGSPQPDLSGNDPHWKIIATGDCWLYDPSPHAGSRVEWSGQCVSRVASGHGTETWKNYLGNVTQLVDLTLVNGVGQGSSQITIPVPGVSMEEIKVPLINGEATGQGTMTIFRNGKLFQEYAGGFVDGKRSGQGRLTTYDPGGAVVSNASLLWANDQPANPDGDDGKSDARTSTPSSPVTPQDPARSIVVTKSDGSGSSTALVQTPPVNTMGKPQSTVGNLDPLRRTEYADIRDHFERGALTIWYGSGQDYNYEFSGDPTASKFETKIRVADGFLSRSQDDRRNNQFAWKTDLAKLHDLKAARIWYKMAFDQLRQEHPEIDPSVYPNRTGLSDNSYGVMYLGYSRFERTPNDSAIQSIEESLPRAQTYAPPPAPGRVTNAKTAERAEAYLVTCSGFNQRLLFLNTGPSSFAAEVSDIAYPVAAGKSSAGDALINLAGRFGVNNSRATDLYSQSHTTGQVRRLVQAGVDQADNIASNRDRDGAVQYIKQCDKIGKDLATAMDW